MKGKEKLNLTKLHSDVLVWVIIPQLVILVTVAHQWKDNVLKEVLRERGEGERERERERERV